MSTPLLTGFDANYASRWLNDGKPILLGRRKYPTFSATMGPPKEDIDTLGGEKVISYANTIPILPTDKTVNFNVRYEAASGKRLPRGTGLSMSNATQSEIANTMQFATSFYNMSELLDKMRRMEGQVASGWKGGENYEQWVINAMVEAYVRDTARAMWNVPTALNSYAPADGVLGSFRNMCSDGLTNAQRGSGGDESASRLFYGTGRDTDPRVRGQYIYKAGGAYTEDIGKIALRTVEEFGAEKLYFPMSNARFSAFEARIRSTYPNMIVPVPEDMSYMLSGNDVIKDGNCIYYYEPALNFLGAITWQIFLDPMVLAFGSSYKTTQVEINTATEREAADKLQGLLKDQNAILDPRRCGVIENLASL